MRIKRIIYLTYGRIMFIRLLVKQKKIAIKEKPDYIHIHNLFPLISPSILPVAKNAGIPVLMTVHNYRLICPNGLFYMNGNICERCSFGREYWCVLKNCENNIIKSVGYALRNWWSRYKSYFLENVNIFVCLTEFQRTKLIDVGFPEEKITVLPNMVEIPSLNITSNVGEYIGFAGRLSQEKGISVLLKAAKYNLEIPFSAAGDCFNVQGSIGDIPNNFRLTGFLTSGRLREFYENSRIIVLPSVWYEGFPITLIEAMLHGKPVICSSIGGLVEIVEEGVTGLLVEPNNAKDLSEKIRYLWERPELCQKMGQAGREKALREYSHDIYYERLMKIYRRAKLAINN